VHISHDKKKKEMPAAEISAWFEKKNKKTTSLTEFEWDKMESDTKQDF
jgi:hypothetical protein